MILPTNLKLIYTQILIVILVITSISGCSTRRMMSHWINTGNTSKLLEVFRDQSEPSKLHKRALRGLYVLGWKPTNQERLEIYSSFASKKDSQKASKLMQNISDEEFLKIEMEVKFQADRINDALTGKDREPIDFEYNYNDIKNKTWKGWHVTKAIPIGARNRRNKSRSRMGYQFLEAQNGKALSIAICQQLITRPNHTSALLQLAIDLGIDTQNDLVAVLREYGSETMISRYFYSESKAFTIGAKRWAHLYNYKISPCDGYYKKHNLCR